MKGRKQVVAVANQKGGVGKTTTTVSLGYDLAQRGYDVLLVDLDSQGHLAVALGDDPAPGLFDLLIGKRGMAAVRCARTFERGTLDYVPGDKSTAVAKQTLVGMDFREYVLAKVLEGAAYDFILIDCAPSLDVLHMAAMVAADWLLVPTCCQHLSAVGIGQILTSMFEINRQTRGDKPLQMLGILPTFYERVTTESHDMLKLLIEKFGSLVLPPIPKDVKLAEAPARGLTIWEYAPESRGVVGFQLDANHQAGGYRQLTERVLRMMGVGDG